MIWAKLAKSIFPLLSEVISRVVPDKAQAAELQNQIQIALLNQDAERLEKQAEIIVAEAQGHSWLQRNWRPIVMLALTSFVGAYWLGFAAPNLPETAIDGLLDIVQVGLGGYVVGRSAEKIAASLAPAMRARST